MYIKEQEIENIVEILRERGYDNLVMNTEGVLPGGQCNAENLLAVPSYCLQSVC